jgi:hypothetical protein
MILVKIIICIFAFVGVVVTVFVLISALNKDKPTFPKPETWNKTLE